MGVMHTKQLISQREQELPGALLWQDLNGNISYFRIFIHIFLFYTDGNERRHWPLFPFPVGVNG